MDQVDGPLVDGDLKLGQLAPQDGAGAAISCAL